MSAGGLAGTLRGHVPLAAPRGGGGLRQHAALDPAVGLYEYLALEVLIWVLFAMGYNMLLGYTGLPSFGHGAFFGIGAYAFGLIQFHVYPSLWALPGRFVVAAAVAGAIVARLHLAPARHLLRAADRSPSARCSCSSAPSGTR